jgi:hypothetical protein
MLAFRDYNKCTPIFYYIKTTAIPLAAVSALEWEVTNKKPVLPANWFDSFFYWHSRTIVVMISEC